MWRTTSAVRWTGNGPTGSRGRRVPVKCGIGDRFSLRRCNDPPPSNGGLPCDGEMFEREDCLGMTLNLAVYCLEAFSV